MQEAADTPAEVDTPEAAGMPEGVDTQGAVDTPEEVDMQETVGTPGLVVEVSDTQEEGCFVEENRVRLAHRS